MSKSKVQHKTVMKERKGQRGSPQVKSFRLGGNTLTLIISLILIAATFVVFWQVRNHSFITFDDDHYVAENPYIRKGLTLKSVIWAFTTNHASNWHPLTWMSHMVDSALYGLKPGGHHVTNLLFHIANTLLLSLIHI